MLEELQRRNYSESTIRGYLRRFSSSPYTLENRQTS
jgi:hypothetical protein